MKNTIAAILAVAFVAFALVFAVPAAADDELYERCLARADDNYNQCMNRADGDNTKESICGARRTGERNSCWIQKGERERQEQRERD